MTLSVKKAKAKDKDKDTVVQSAAGKLEVMLGNGCKRFVDHASGLLYEAGVKYKVTAAQRVALFKFKDDFGVRLFYDADVIQEQLKAARIKRRKQLIAAGDETAELEQAQEEAEKDTGAMKLEDEDGKSVGTIGA